MNGSPGYALENPGGSSPISPRSSHRCTGMTMVLFVGLFFITAVGYGQHLRSNKLFDFLKTQFDSTVVFCRFSNWNTAPDYLILCKKQDRYFLFTYKSPYESIGKYPDSLKSKFISLQTQFQLMEPDVNQYFLPKRISDSLVAGYWGQLDAKHLWQLQSAGEEPECIDAHGMKNNINDGGEIFFALITNSGKRVIEFYAPEFYEEHCPGNPNRIQALRVIKLLNGIL